MFNFFKKSEVAPQKKQANFEVELTAAVLAYEIARSDGDIDEKELSVLMSEIEKHPQQLPLT